MLPQLAPLPEENNPSGASEGCPCPSAQGFVSATCFYCSNKPATASVSACGEGFANFLQGLNLVGEEDGRMGLASPLAQRWAAKAPCPCHQPPASSTSSAYAAGVHQTAAWFPLGLFPGLLVRTKAFLCPSRSQSSPGPLSAFQDWHRSFGLPKPSKGLCSLTDRLPGLPPGCGASVWPSVLSPPSRTNILLSSLYCASLRSLCCCKCHLGLSCSPCPGPSLKSYLGSFGSMCLPCNDLGGTCCAVGATRPALSHSCSLSSGHVGRTSSVPSWLPASLCLTCCRQSLTKRNTLGCL